MPQDIKSIALDIIRNKAEEERLRNKRIAMEKEINETKVKIVKKKQRVMTLLEMPCPVPECPVCLEPMVGQIFNCPNGHLICGDCRAQVVGNICTICRDQYVGRASETENMVGKMTSLG